MVSYSVLACDNVGTTTVTSKVAVTIPFSETLLPLRVIYLVKKRAQLKQAVTKMVTGAHSSSRPPTKLQHQQADGTGHEDNKEEMVRHVPF